ncbi:MAG: prepilin-type cleavage/methylation domain-containing protein [Parafilimonas terrae]|nr:prepilin-type cleavage/methylation domain-containing protein [Parafilimonas terrae]
MAVAVSGAVLLGLFSLTDLVSRHARGVSARVEAAERSRRGLDSLVRDIGLAQRVRWAGPTRDRAFVFQGRFDRILVAVDAAMGAAEAPTRLVQLQSEPDGVGADILYTEADFPPAARSLDELHFTPTRVLFRSPRRLRFAYIAAATDKAPEIAVDTWDLPDAMPVAVRVSLNDAVTGLPLLERRIPLHIEAEAGCTAPTKAFCSRPIEKDEDGEGSTAAIVNALQGRKP